MKTLVFKCSLLLRTARVFGGSACNPSSIHKPESEGTPQSTYSAHAAHINPYGSTYSLYSPYIAIQGPCIVHTEPIQSIEKLRGGIQSIYSAYTVHIGVYRPTYSA